MRGPVRWRACVCVCVCVWVHMVHGACGGACDLRLPTVSVVPIFAIKLLPGIKFLCPYLNHFDQPMDEMMGRGLT